MSQNPSQYPSPYLAPNAPLNYGAPGDPLAPAKRASVLMFILGPLGLLLGTCLFSMPFMLRAAPGPEADRLRQQLAESAHASVDVLFPVVAAMFVIPSLLMLVFAFFVRRGRRGATLSATILVGLIMGFWILNLVSSLFTQSLDAKAGAGLCFGVALLSIFGLQLSWLIAAFRVSGQAANAQQQYAAQYWQHQQAMQAYAYTQQQGYPPQTYAPQGYATAPPPPVSPPPTPPAQPLNPQPPQPSVEPSDTDGPAT